jgi:hypothetical protein
MALTIANSSPHSGDVWGRQVTRIVTVTFDSSYDETNGESFVPGDVGMSEFTFVGISPDAAALPGYVVQYDYTNERLEVFGVEQDADAAVTDRLDPEDNATDLSTLKVRILCVGH